MPSVILQLAVNDLDWSFSKLRLAVLVIQLPQKVILMCRQEKNEKQEANLLLVGQIG